MPAEEFSPETSKLLRDAFEGLLEQIQTAREAIDNPALFVPPASDRNLAEGYRYLLGYVYASFERSFFENPEFPYFRRAIPPISKSTLDNADNLYLSARIDGADTYVISGRAYDAGHWRGGVRKSAGRLAPQYVIFNTTTEYSGDIGNLSGLAKKSDIDVLDSFDIALEEDGGFEILVAPTRPQGHRGNYLCSQLEQQNEGGSQLLTARYLICRQLFGDWEREYSLELYLDKVGNRGAHPPPLTPELSAQQMQHMGALVNNQMRYWNEFYVKLLNPYADQPGLRPTFARRNAINSPRFTQSETGGQATNSYASGIYDLAPQEVLLVEDHFPEEKPVYTGFHLGNYWGESYDYENHTSSLNDFQAQPDADGVVRYVVAHSDPGVANWIDTTGHSEGYMTRRWTYHQPPAELPRVIVEKLSVAELEQALPADTRRCSPAERVQQIAVRRRHVRRRFRQS